MKNSKLILLVFLPIIISACDAIMGKEVARLPINFASGKDSTLIKEVTLDLKKDEEISFWSEIDIEYEGDAQMRFRVQALRDTVVTANFEIDPTDKNVTIGETKVSIMDKTTWSFTGRNAKIVADKDGTYTIKAMLVTNDNPTLKINKAELVIKK